MAKLSEIKCIPCEGWEKPLDESQIQTYLPQLTLDWKIIDNIKLQRRFEFKDFKQAMEFVNKIAEVAESEGHHPDIYIYYNKVDIMLSTHVIKGLSQNDFVLAAKIEELLK